MYKAISKNTCKSRTYATAADISIELNEASREFDCLLKEATSRELDRSFIRFKNSIWPSSSNSDLTSLEFWVVLFNLIKMEGERLRFELIRACVDLCKCSSDELSYESPFAVLLFITLRNSPKETIRKLEMYRMTNMICRLELS